MATTRTIQVHGLKELHDAMAGLSADMHDKVAKASASAAARLVRNEARKNIVTLGLVDTGNMLAAVSIAKSKRTKLAAQYRVGVRSGGGFRAGDLKAGKVKGKLGQDAYYWRFHEKGAPGAGIDATPFIEPALAGNIHPAIEAMSKEIAKRLRKIVPKGGFGK